MFGLDLMIFLAILIAGYMAWNIGANDVANAMGTSVGSGALTFRNAIIAAAIFEFLGAFFAGDAVTDTVRKGILNFEEADLETYSTELKYGFIAAMFAAALWLTVATKYGLPVSTTHSIVGGILGIGIYVAPDHVDWEVVTKIVMSWVASPLLGGILAYTTFVIVKKVIMDAEDPIERSRIMAPILALPTFFVLGLALQYKAMKGLIKRLDSEGILNKAEWLPAKEGTTFNIFEEGAWLPLNSLLLALFIGIIASSILYWILRDYEFEEKGYQSDYRTTLMLIRENIRKGRGRQRIKQEFYKKQITMPSNIDELIDMANSESEEFREFVDPDDSLVEGVDWLKLAVEARTKKYGDTIPVQQKEKAKQLRFLQYRGFKTDICFQALNYTLETLDERF